MHLTYQNDDAHKSADRPLLEQIGISEEMLAALEAAGMAIVPAAPTELMVEAAWADALAEDAAAVWRAMVAEGKITR